MKLKNYLFFLLLFFSLQAFGQQYTISGYIKDSKTGEELIGAAVYIESSRSGTTTNVYGFYSLTLPKGTYKLLYSYLGYNNKEITINLTSNQKEDTELDPTDVNLDEITVSGERKDRNVKDIEMSTQKLQMKTVKKMPALMGEVDIIKTIQLLPGVQTSGEGTSGFHVRGGGVDQNLILLDEATVFNSSHVGGIISVFNSDAVKDIKMFKGGIPAEYGGRLSSVLDIRMKDGNSKKLEVAGGIGLISSRLTIETPIYKDKCTAIVSGRRSYFDLFFPLFKKLKGSKVFFHDFNAKLNYRINENNRIFISGYSGKDVMQFDEVFDMYYGNQTFTLRYNHVFSNKVFSNLTFIYSDYDYGMGVEMDAMNFNWHSYIVTKTLKNDYSYFINLRNTLKFGYSLIHYHFEPGFAESVDSTSIFNDLSLEPLYAYEPSVFISMENKISSRITLYYGLRYSAFLNVGEGISYCFNTEDVDDYTVCGEESYSKGEIYNTYTSFEPRLSFVLQVNANSSVKAGYNRTAQYIHLATNTYAVTPLDLWFPSSPNVKPQYADQGVIGYFRNFLDNTVETSIELYYKKMYNVIDFKDHAELFLNEEFEGELRIGDGYSYGAEFLVKKQEGKFTGWFGYTYSSTTRTIPGINDGKSYYAPYDKTHDLSIVTSYDISKRINVSANWVFSTGAARTMPTGTYKTTIGGKTLYIPIYSERNAERLPTYHRLDLACTYNFKTIKQSGKKRKLGHSLTLSVYNAYSRHNAYSVVFKQSEDNVNIRQAEKLYLFKIFPSLTYNFHF